MIPTSPKTGEKWGTPELECAGDLGRREAAFLFFLFDFRSSNQEISHQTREGLQLDRVPASTQFRLGRFKRLAVIITGWTFIALGMVGLFLPFLQGILFILIGLVILSKEHHWAGRLVARLRSRFPKLDKWFAWAHRKVEEIFGYKSRGNVRATRD